MKFAERRRARRRFFELWREHDGDEDAVMDVMQAEFGASANWLAIIELITMILELIEKLRKD